MVSRFRFFVLATLAVAFFLAAPSQALEKTAQRFTDSERDSWGRAVSTCSVVYYNFCTGWIWIWSPWTGGDQMGVTYEACCGPSHGAYQQSLSAWLYFPTGAPSGYGFTGTLDVSAADANFCPTGAPLRSQPFLPTTLWNFVDWRTLPVNVTGVDFSLTFTVPTVPFNYPMTLASDHPLAVGTDPPQCGTCFPTTRVNHSFRFADGETGQTYCPGVSFFDNLCDAELVWDVGMTCSTPVEDFSWGRVKQLYR